MADRGRPTKYDPKFCDEILAYFQKEPFTVLYKKEYHKDGTLKAETPIMTANELPTFQGFASKIGVHFDTLREWVDKYSDFSLSYARAKQMQEHIWLINGMQNLYNAQFAQFFGKNCLGYKDKVEVDSNLSGDISVVFCAADADTEPK